MKNMIILAVIVAILYGLLFAVLDSEVLSKAIDKKMSKDSIDMENVKLENEIKKLRLQRLRDSLLIQPQGSSY